MSVFDFIGLETYLADEMITDINYNGRDLWCDHLEKGRFVEENYLNAEHFMQLCLRFANQVNKQFNSLHPVLEADYEDLRVSFIHPSVAGFLSISIRKVSQAMRLNETMMISSRYCTKSCLKLLSFCVRGHLNVMISGLPGSGKTELLKFLTQYIPAGERVLTIEDNYEIHYRYLHPHKDAVSLRVNEHLNYDEAIYASLRQRPNWVLFSEVRGEEVVGLLKVVAMGTYLISTIHARSAWEIAQRMTMLMPNYFQSQNDLLNRVISHLDIGIHLDIRHDEQGIHRYIREIVAYHPEPVLLYHFQDKRSITVIPAFLRQQARGDVL